LHDLFGTVLAKSPRVSIRLHRGSLLLHDRAYRPTVAEQGRLVAGRLANSTTYSFDPEFFQLLLHDLCESIGGGWTTVDLPGLPTFLGRSNVHVISVSRLSRSLAEIVDGGFRHYVGYHGAIAINPTEPLQRELLWSSLFYELFIARRRLVMVLGADDPFDLTEPDGWWEGLPFVEVRWRTDIDREPPDLRSLADSQRARAAGKRFAAKSVRSPTERVIRALALESRPTIPIKVELLPGAPAALVPPEKLIDYLLNPDHLKGGPKARAFREVLGIEREDWRWLAAQIEVGVLVAPLAKVRVEEFERDPPGVKYHVDLAILGRNGAIKGVRTGWIVADDKPPRPTTAYIESKIIVRDLPAPEAPPLIDAGLAGDKRWAALFEIAELRGEEAAVNAVPTPMWVDRIGYSEGELGGAVVTVPDARRGFARWLIKEQKATLGYRGGAEFVRLDGSQSRARAEAYARSFARVLALNDVLCAVRPYLS